MVDTKPFSENEMGAFVMGYHIYKKTWKPFIGEKLDEAMEPNNLIDKYGVAIFQERQKHFVVYLPLEHSGKFEKNLFYSLEANKENSCKVIIHGKAVNQKDGRSTSQALVI